ncbi:protein CYSTEINE-RICH TRANSMEMBRANE MODULE 9-like [Mercurialis annua]|uniref:protein CYSTEINE-RICH TRANSMEMBRANE MODULE 9-like n=1 Tax=Mercurialis annua TaxID=3986 RepID=UPI00215E4CA9|nr:protein CYSTEINE-RICH TRANSMEMBRANE MODULE 9-like [Mercurialis annua]
MSHYNHQQSPAVSPPPVGYPMKNGPETECNVQNQPSAPVETKQRGGLCKGLCAGMCFCCLLFFLFFFFFLLTMIEEKNKRKE